MSVITKVESAPAPVVPQYRAPARRISAAGQADRTAQAFEGVVSEFKAMFESMREENASLRERLITAEAQSAEKETATTAALAAQAEIVTSLRLEVLQANSTIGNLAVLLEQAIARLSALEEKHAGHTHGFSSPSPYGTYTGLNTGGPSR